MTLNTKFSIGDKVFSIGIVYEYEQQQCSMCAGNGTVPYMNQQVICPLCRGSKTEFKAVKEVWELKDESTVTGIQVLIENGIVEEYKLDNSKFVKATEIFLTKEEAQQECQKRNENTI